MKIFGKNFGQMKNPEPKREFKDYSDAELLAYYEDIFAYKKKAGPRPNVKDLTDPQLLMLRENFEKKNKDMLESWTDTQDEEVKIGREEKRFPVTREIQAIQSEISERGL
jgi:hypothetical protein